jgi:hypothetical protein
LTQSSTIQAAGAIREIDPIEIHQAPRVPLTAYEVSVGLSPVIGINDADPIGVWIEAGLAQALMINQGDILSTSFGNMPIAHVFTWPNDGRDARFSFAVLLPVVSNAVFDECWIKSWPVVDDNDQLLRSTVMVSSSMASGQVTQLNKNLGITLDANRLFHERVTRHCLWAAPIAMLVIGFVAPWLRRLEYATALHARQARSALLLGMEIETLIWASTGALVTLVVDMAGIRAMRLAQAWPVWLSCVQVVIWSLLGVVTGALIGTSLIKEKHMFRYFKIR